MEMGKCLPPCSFWEQEFCINYHVELFPLLLACCMRTLSTNMCQSALNASCAGHFSVCGFPHMLLQD